MSGCKARRAVAIVTADIVSRLTLDAYVLDTLMPDLVGHDRQPSAFVVYLYLLQIATDTGLSKSAVQLAVGTLRRRQLLRTSQVSATAAPTYAVLTPWVR